MVNPREHRVVVVESLFCPSHFRNTLARALFSHFNVSTTNDLVWLAIHHFSSPSTVEGS